VFFKFLEKFKYYLVLLGITMESISLKLEPAFLNAIKKIMKKHNYMTKTEFIREALRDKIKQIEEREILSDKSMVAQLRESEKNLKKGKIKKFEY
jgi:metal-responsive CopG/Arc/MetJ family transcriptional regulator